MVAKAGVVLLTLTLVVSIMSIEGDFANTYLASTYMSIILLSILICAVFAKIRFEICYVDIVMLSVLGFSILQHWLLDIVQYKVTLYYEILIASTAFMVYRNLAKQNRQIALECLLATIMLCNVFEYARLIISALPIADTISNHWGNSGVFAVFLALCCCIIAILFHRFSNYYIKAILLTLFVTNLITTIYLQSRLSWIIIVMSILYAVHQKYNFVKRRHLIIFGVVSLLIVAFAFKRDSSFGRILIAKVTIRMIIGNPLIGVGLNNFAAEYPKYQAGNYATGKMSDKEMMLADNTLTAFNEPLQIICELGLFGIGLLIILITAFIKHRNSNKDIIPLILTMILATCFYYILHNTFIFNTLLFVCAYYFSQAKPIISVKSMYLSPLFIVLTSSVGYFYPKFIAVSKMETNAKTFYYNGFNKYLADNPVYLNSYASFLFNNGKTNEAFDILQKLKKYVLWYSPLVIEGDCYNIKHNSNSAEQSYLLAKNLCPSKFTARHKLFNLYQQTNNPNKAIKEAKEIIELKEKVPSSITLAIKLNAQNYLNNNKQND